MRSLIGGTRLHISAFAVAVLSVIVSMNSCESADCKDYAAYGLGVKVIDRSGEPVCDAVVTAMDGRYSEVLAAFPAGPNGEPCEYSGAIERRGTYKLEVTHDGIAKTVDHIKVSADECHVRRVVVTVSLER